MKNKNLIIGGIVLALAGAGYFMWNKNKKSAETTTPETTGTNTTTDTSATPPATNTTPTTNTTPSPNNTAPSTDVVQWKEDPTHGIYVKIDGKKYAFASEKAFQNYGYSVPKLITKAELDAIPNGGFVDDTGKVIKS
jgi:cytoskeletal protein RodZ